MCLSSLVRETCEVDRQELSAEAMGVVPADAACQVALSPAAAAANFGAAADWRVHLRVAAKEGQAMASSAAAEHWAHARELACSPEEVGEACRVEETGLASR